MQQLLFIVFLKIPRISFMVALCLPPQPPHHLFEVYSLLSLHNNAHFFTGYNSLYGRKFVSFYNDNDTHNIVTMASLHNLDFSCSL